MISHVVSDITMPTMISYYDVAAAEVAITTSLLSGGTPRKPEPY